jgi:hypothetical protein
MTQAEFHYQFQALFLIKIPPSSATAAPALKHFDRAVYKLENNCYWSLIRGPFFKLIKTRARAAQHKNAVRLAAKNPLAKKMCIKKFLIKIATMA